MKLADFYHKSTRHSHASLKNEKQNLNWALKPEVYKHYRGKKRIKLPEPVEKSGRSTRKAIEISRQKTHAFLSRELDQERLSAILHYASGITSEVSYPGEVHRKRAAPSAGALYPTVSYVMVRRVRGVAAGLYHYDVRHHTLTLLKEGDSPVTELARSLPDQRAVEAPLILIFSSYFQRSSWKYGKRAYRYCLLDAGHLALQASLAASALGLGCQWVGRFDDMRVNRMLGLNENLEGALLIMPIGWPDAEEQPPERIQNFLPLHRELAGGDPYIMQMHAGCMMAREETMGERDPDRMPREEVTVSDSKVALPRPDADGMELFSAISRRRSTREWSVRGMDLQRLSSVLYSCQGAKAGYQWPYHPSIENNQALNLYLIAHQVIGLKQGVYAYQPLSHSLSFIREGNMQGACRRMSIFQDMAGEADALVVMTMDRSRCFDPDGDRGYRYGAMDAGMAGGRLYLAATAKGMGICGIGSFFDEEVSHLIGTPEEEEYVIYMAALGEMVE